MANFDLPFPMPTQALQKVEGLPYPLVAAGKVREVFDMGDALLMVATDRVSAFDVVMNEGLAGKGILLTQISLYWFARAGAITQHHLVDDHAARIEALGKEFPELQYRSMIVKKLSPLPIEAVVRGYLSGSGWKAYKQSGKLFEYDLPSDLQESSALPKPVFTPTTKAASGHDMPIDCADAAKLIGEDLFQRVHDLSIELYQMGVARADAADIILADTKFEFGYVKDLNGNNKLIYMDEVGTPDSSRIWDAQQYAKGRVVENSKEGFRQLLLNHFPDPDILLNKDRMQERLALAENNALPSDVLMQVSKTYIDIAEKITGQKLALSENPKAEIIQILRQQYQLVD